MEGKAEEHNDEGMEFLSLHIRVHVFYDWVVMQLGFDLRVMVCL